MKQPRPESAEPGVRQIEETRLPAIGIRHDFSTVGGRRIGLVTNFSGRRKLLVYDERDPDACQDTVDLDDADVRTLTEVLGAPQVVQKLSDLQQAVAGLTIDWLEIPSTSPFAGKTIGESQIRTRTGASVVALIRDGGEVVPSPTPDDTIGTGDTLVVVGTPQGTLETAKLLGIA